MARHNNYIYQIHDKNDDTIDVLNNIDEVLFFCYKIDNKKKDKKYWQKYRQVWNSINKSPSHCIKPNNYPYMVHRLEEA